MKRRILAILLTLCMILGMMPSVAFAATVGASNYAETLEKLGYTFTLSGVHITEAGYYKLDGTKVDSEAEAQVQVTDPVNKKMKYLNGTTWQDVSRVYETEHTAWEKEAVGVYVAGEQITESGTYYDGTISVDLENKKITLNGATINHTTGEMALLENIVDPDYTGSSYQGKSLYDNITGSPGVLVITESTYRTPGSGAGAGNWDCYFYWPIGYNTSYKFGSIALGIMADDESGDDYEDWTIELKGENKITVNNTFGMPQQIGYLLDAPAYGIFAESNLTITGTGSLETVVNNEWDILKAGYMDYQNSCVAGGVWALGDLAITGGTITAETSTKTIDSGAGFEMTHNNFAGAIGATGSVTISGEETVVSATDTTSQGSAIRGTAGVTITENATVVAESASDVAGTASMAGVCQWSFAPIEISEGPKVTAKAESTNANDQFGTGMGIVGGIIEVEDAEVKVDAQAAGINAGSVIISSGNIIVNVSHEEGKAINAETGDIAVGSFNTPIDSDLIADSSVIADGSVMPKDELAEYTARIEKTYYTGEEGGNKAIADLVNKQVVWLNTDTDASRSDFDLGDTVTIMLAEGKNYTGQIYGTGVKADIVEGNQEEMDGVVYTEYVYTMVVNSEDAGAKVVHADGTETYYKELFGSDGCIYVTNKLSDGDTVVVLKDSICDYYGGYDLERDVTLDLNGKTLTFEDTGGLNVEGKADDTVIVTIIDSSEEKTGKIINTYNSSSYTGATVIARQYSEVTIEGGTYDGKTQSLGGKLNLTGGAYLREVVAGKGSNVIGTTIVGEAANITECTAYADGGILILPNQNIGGDISNVPGTDNVKWKLVDAEGNDADYADVEAGDCKLVIYGTGEMMSFRREDAPWIGYNGIVSEIIIEDGVTNISEGALENMNGYDLTLGKDITSINTFAADLLSVKNLGVITIPKEMTANVNSILNGYGTVYRTVEGFVVEEGNEVYSTDGKALYYSGDAEGKKLMKAVAMIEGDYEIDTEIVDIKACAFNNVLFGSLKIPASFENVYTFRKPEAVPEGMVFGGYYTSLDNTIVEELRIDTTGNKEFTVYMILGYEVTYDFGNSEEVVVVPNGKVIGDFAPDVTVDGKRLLGWSTTADGTETDASALVPTEAMTVYAVWEVDEEFTPEYSNIEIEPIENQTYTGAEIKPAVYYTEGGVRKQVAESYLVYEDNTNVGTATVKVVVGDEEVASATFIIDKAEFDPRNYAWTGSTKVDYDGEMHALTIKDLPEGITVTYTYDGTVADGIADVKYYSGGSVANYTVKATFNLGENYKFASGLSSYSQTKTSYLTINPLEVTIIVDDKTMYVGEDIPAFTYTVEGLEDGMTLTTEPTMTTSASGNKAGNFPITASVAIVNNDANNFKITYEEGYLTVGMKILDAGISFANDEVIYDGNAHSIEIDVEGTLPDSFSVDYTMDGQPFTGVTNAGIYTVTANITSADPAYDEIEPLTAELTIVPAELTIIAEDKTVKVGDEMPELTYKVEGLIGEDTVTTAPALTTDADLSQVGEYTITASGADAGDNYTIEYVDGTLTVKKSGNGGGSGGSATTEPEEPVVPTNPFKDVDEKDYFYNAVMWAVANGVTSGTSADTFSPDATCTRAQTVTFLWNAAGKPEPKSTTCPFTDVAPTAYYYKAVLWAVEEGITSGTSATTFGPEQIVTRGQNVTFLWKFADKPAVEDDSKFADVSEANYYHDAVVWAAEEGITSGTSATTFGPENPCTRAQIVTFLYRHMVEE